MLCTGLPAGSAPECRAAAIVVAVVAALAIALAAAPGRAAAGEPCPAPPGFSALRVSVPLDHAGAVPGRRSLCVQRRPARGPRRGALLLLAGGPGESGTAAFTGTRAGREHVLRTFGAALADHDLLVVDQRGTGRSGYLLCPGFDLRAEPPVTARPAGITTKGARGCADALGRARSFYTTRDTIEDLDLVRRRIGVERLAIFGVSYGTKVAVDYARAHPGNVERLLLDSSLAPEGVDVFERAARTHIPEVLTDLCADGACRGIATDPARDLRTLATRVRARPLRGPVVAPDGRRVTSTLDARGLLNILYSGDLDASLRAALPGAMRAALAGDPAPIVRLLEPPIDLRPLPPAPPLALSQGLFIATSCEEAALPWSRTASAAERRRQADAAARALGPDAFEPFGRGNVLGGGLIPICSAWPDSRRAPAPLPSPPAVPTLVLSGLADLRTPLAGAERTAAVIPGARVVRVGGTGHSVLGPTAARNPAAACARAVTRAFLRGVAGPTACPGRAPVAPLAIPPRRVDVVAAPAGTSGSAGRIAGAAALTVRDALARLRTLSADELAARAREARGAGLRAGAFRARVRPESGRVAVTALDLRSASYAPGVRVSGRLLPRGTALAGSVDVVAGRVRGTLRFTRSAGIEGRVGGRGVRGRLPATLPARIGARRIRHLP